VASPAACVSALTCVALLAGAAQYAAGGPDRTTPPQNRSAVERPATRAELAAQLTRTRNRLQHAERRARILERTLRHDPSVGEALTLASVVYGVPRSSLAAVAWCESGHRPWARNGQYRGIFQQGPMFEASPFGRAGLSVWSPYAAALSTAYTVRAQGWRQWSCQPGGR